MRIDDFLWLAEIEEKLAVKHHVETSEVEEVFRNAPRFRFRERGRREGEGLYLALGQTDAGRYLVVLFIHKPATEQRPLSRALVISARDMTDKERRQYERK